MSRTYRFNETSVFQIFVKIHRESRTVCNFQSTKSPVELNNLLSKFFCYITWLVISPDQRRHWTTCKRDFYVKSYCTFETIAQRIKNYKLRRLLSDTLYMYLVKDVFPMIVNLPDVVKNGLLIMTLVQKGEKFYMKKIFD